MLFLWVLMVVMFASVINNHNDIVKQWMAVKCVLNGIDPYSLALNVLESKIGPDRAKHINLWEIRGFVDENSQRHGFCQPTDATYSPAMLGFLVLSVGAFGKASHVVIAWLFLNSLAIASIFRSRTMRSLGGDGSLFGVSKPLLMFVTFFPVVFTLQIGQFSLLVLAGVLSALDYEDRPMVSGFFLFMMLLKPTLGIPLLAMFPIRRYWRALSVALILCLLSSLAVAVLTHVEVLELFREWLGVGWYYGWNKTWSIHSGVAWYIKYLLLAAALGAVYLSRLTYGKSGVALAGAFACMWTYTQYYDYVLCLPFFVLIFAGYPKIWQNVLSVRTMKIVRTVGLWLFGVISLCSLASSLIVMQIIPEGWGVLRTVKECSMVVLLMLSLLLLGQGMRGKSLNAKSVENDLSS